MSGDDPTRDAERNRALLQRAVERHHAGALGEAIDLYRQALSDAAMSVDGMVEGEVWRLLGVALRATGDFGGALDALDNALARTPGDAAVLVERGATLQDLGRPADAVNALRAVIPLASESVPGHATLADAYRALDQTHDAIPHYRRLVELAPDVIDAHINLGVCLQETGDVVGAIACYRAALEADAESGAKSGAAATNLGLALMESGDLHAAVAPLERGAALDPTDPLALNGLGAAYLRLGRTDDAERAIRRAIDTAPDHALAWSNLGNVYQDRRRLDDALAAHDKSIALDPENGDLHWNRAMTLLLSGDLKRGFAAYEWRRRTRDHAPPGHDSPQWDGGDPAGKHLLVLAEQGFGDSIQFARYAPLLTTRGARVTLACPPKLVDLFGSLGGDIALVTNTGDAHDVDCHAPLMSLPFLCGASAETIPADIPYLAAPPGATRPPPSGGRRRVGLCWTGNPDHPDNPHRSCPLDAFAPLFGQDGVRQDGVRQDGIEWISLQYGHGAARGADADRLTDWTEFLEGFANTAAALEALDLVITIDTSTAHLAGALGRPTWLLLKYTPDWRWMLDRDDSPWYPTLRLFRQSRAGQWDDVVARLVDKLERQSRDWITE